MNAALLQGSDSDRCAVEAELKFSIRTRVKEKTCLILEVVLLVGCDRLCLIEDAVPILNDLFVQLIVREMTLLLIASVIAGRAIIIS